jgi:diaminopimelate epimerase
MRSFNRDGSEGKMAGNNIRSVGKYLYDKGYVRSEDISMETASGVKTAEAASSGRQGQFRVGGHGAR